MMSDALPAPSGTTTETLRAGQSWAGAALILENGIARQGAKHAALRARVPWPRAAFIVPSVAFAVVCFFQSILNRKITGKRPDAAQNKQSAQREQYQHARLLLGNVRIFPVRRLPRFQRFVEGLVQA